MATRTDTRDTGDHNTADSGSNTATYDGPPATTVADPPRTQDARGAIKPRVPGLFGELLAEFLGTFVLILFGCGVVAQVAGANIGGHDSIAWAWGLGVTLGIYVAGKISGAHLNPAVTVALAVFQGFSWRKVLPYSIAQTAGAFVAALLVRWNYTEILAKADPGHTLKTQGVFSTLPGNGTLPVSDLGALRDQIIGTAILVFVIFALTDARNQSPLANLAPFIIGLLIVAIGMAWGTDAGYAINPARDFGPRLASFLTGYGSAWRDQYGSLFVWVPIVGPLAGALVGGALYQSLIHRFLPDPETEARAESAAPAEAAR